MNPLHPAPSHRAAWDKDDLDIQYALDMNTIRRCSVQEQWTVGRTDDALAACTAQYEADAHADDWAAASPWDGEED